MRITKVQVSVIGMKNFGKTWALRHIQTSVKNGMHGFARDSVTIDTGNEETRKMIREGRTAPDIGTDRTYKWKFNLALSNGDQNQEWELNILDLPGEVFNYKHEQRENGIKFDAWNRESVGAVILISAPEALDRSNYQYLQNAITYEANAADESEESESNGASPGRSAGRKMRRIVVVISKFELYLLHFGSIALDLATSPRRMAKLLGYHLEAMKDSLGDFHEPGLDVRFTAFSTFGFVPRFGCPNVMPVYDIALDVFSQSTKPFGDSRYYPFLVADPFVFAATGKETPYLFTIDQLFQ